MKKQNMIISIIGMIITLFAGLSIGWSIPRDHSMEPEDYLVTNENDNLINGDRSHLLGRWREANGGSLGIHLM